MTPEILSRKIYRVVREAQTNLKGGRRIPCEHLSLITLAAIAGVAKTGRSRTDTPAAAAAALRIYCDIDQSRITSIAALDATINGLIREHHLEDYLETTAGDDGREPGASERPSCLASVSGVSAPGTSDLATGVPLVSDQSPDAGALERIADAPPHRLILTD